MSRVCVCVCARATIGHIRPSSSSSTAAAAAEPFNYLGSSAVQRASLERLEALQDEGEGRGGEGRGGRAGGGTRTTNVARITTQPPPPFPSLSCRHCPRDGVRETFSLSCPKFLSRLFSPPLPSSSFPSRRPFVRETVRNRDRKREREKETRRSLPHPPTDFLGQQTNDEGNG